MINITDLQQEQKLLPLLRLGFRPFFLLGAAFGAVAIALWTLSLHSLVLISPLNGVLWWHSHEMLFGFVPAIVAGFLLTAVQTWTGVASVKGKKLLFLVGLWLSARLLILFNPAISLWVVMLVDLAFLPLVGLFLAIPLVRVGQQRNMIFLPILVFMSLANLLTYLPQFGSDPAITATGLNAMVMLTTLLVALIGGRVIPMFTANGTNTVKVIPLKWLEFCALSSLFLIFILMVTGLSSNHLITGTVCAVSAVLHAYRNLRWRPWVTLKVPLVWVLHIAIMFIPIGLAMLAVHYLMGTVTLSVAIHSLTVGVIGGMILAMIARVSLGHTGRPLKPHPVMTLAFVAIAIAAVIRSLAVAIMPSLSVQFWWVSGTLWCIAFGCFVVLYLPILTRPRVDGRPG